MQKRCFIGYTCLLRQTRMICFDKWTVTIEFRNTEVTVVAIARTTRSAREWPAPSAATRVAFFIAAPLRHFFKLGGCKRSMAEICLEIVGRESPAATVAAMKACEKNTQAARRRRIQIRRLRCIAGVEPMEKTVDLSRKRHRTEIPVNPRVVLFRKDSDEDVKKAASKHSPRYGVTSVCGLRREMEDAVSIWTDFLKHGEAEHSFFGVFDGHGCSHVAEWCQNRMHEMVEDEVDKLESGLMPSPVEWKGVMERSFSRMDEEVVIWGGASGERRNANCRCELQTPKCEHVGSTAVVAVVGSEHIIVANCGDSRAILCRRGAVVPLSIDHKPDRPDEMQRIQDAGGRVIFWDGPRVQGVLAMSRAIGDGYLKPYVTAEPEVTVTERKEEDEFLILASDGLWDVVTNETACEIVRMCLHSSGRSEVKGGGPAKTSDKACSDAATLLTKMALARRSADNVTVVVVDLRKKL